PVDQVYEPRDIVAQVPPPTVTPLVDAVCVPPPTVTPSPDIPPSAWCEVADGAVGFVQAVARAIRAVPRASATARRERTSMYTSGAVGRMRRYGCTYSWRLHPSRQSRIGSSGSSFGRKDLCSS